MLDGAAVLNPPLYAELAAVVAGALGGAAYAARKDLDVVGIFTMALVSGLGGGVIRDVLLSEVPVTLKRPVYLLTVAIVALVGFVFATALHKLFARLLTVVDAAALGLFTVIGVQKSLNADLPVASALLLGVITGVGGELLRDLFTGEIPPRVLTRDAPVATVALLGGAIYAIGTLALDMDALAAEAVAVGVVLVVRLLAIHFRWITPGAVDLTPKLRRGRKPAQ